jgi:hypothetical protein
MINQPDLINIKNVILPKCKSYKAHFFCMQASEKAGVFVHRKYFQSSLVFKSEALQDSPFMEALTVLSSIRISLKCFTGVNTRAQC